MLHCTTLLGVRSSLKPSPIILFLTWFCFRFIIVYPFQSWSAENSPSTSPRESSDSGISSNTSEETKQPESPQPSDSSMFVAGNPFAGLSMVAAAMAAVSGKEKLPSFTQPTETGLNLSTSSSSQQQRLSEESSPEAPPSSNGNLTEDREVRSRAVKSEKVMHSCPHCNFTTVMSQHMKSHLVS